MLNFSKMIVRYDWLLCNMCVSVLQKSWKDPVSLKELHNIPVTSLAGLGLLHKVFLALSNDSADLHYLTIRPATCKGYVSIANEENPNGLLTHGP